MNTAVVWIFGILALLIILYSIYWAIQYMLLPTSPTRVGNEQIDLSSATTIMTSDALRTLWSGKSGTSGATLIFYVNPTIKDRTAVSGSEYANLVQIGSTCVFKILTAPDASRGLVLSPAQIVITESPSAVGATNPTETIEIPNFPLQKWTAVAIVKQGRKFNIYINGKLKVSHMCTAMPIDIDKPLIVGDVRLGGTLALMSIASRPMQSDEIRSIVQNTVDIDGKPHLYSNILPFLSFPISFPFSFMNSLLCPGGNCSTSGTTLKIRPFEEWVTSYA
jgi:hypothetical protein